MENPCLRLVYAEMHFSREKRCKKLIEIRNEIQLIFYLTFVEKDLKFLTLLELI